MLYRRLDSLLKAGTTCAILRANGKTHFEKDLLICSESGKDITFLTCFIILFGKLFGSVVLLVFKS